MSMHYLILLTEVGDTVIKDLRYISIRQYIDTFFMYCDMLL